MFTGLTGPGKGCAPDFVTVCMDFFLGSYFINVNNETYKSHLLMLFFFRISFYA